MTLSPKELYLSVDVECFGPCPGLHSMVQLGAALYDYTGKELGSFSRNIEEADATVRDPDTMAWWAKQEIEFPGIMERLLQDRVTPYGAMHSFTHFVEQVEKQYHARIVVVAYPAGFDFSHLYYNLMRYTGRSCVGLSALDLKTLTMPLFPGRGYRSYGRRDFPKSWSTPKLPHTHDALADAKEQAFLLFQVVDSLPK